jgi:hypothetical protein
MKKTANIFQTRNELSVLRNAVRHAKTLLIEDPNRSVVRLDGRLSANAQREGLGIVPLLASVLR